MNDDEILAQIHDLVVQEREATDHHDPERRRRLAERGRERAGQLSIERMARGYERVFTDLMERG